MTVNEVLTSGENNLDYDAGYFKPATIGDYVWTDTNGNGIQDNGEPGVPGVIVVLSGTDGAGNPVSLTTTTNGTGNYNFTGLVPGTYKVTFTAPSGTTFTTADQGGNDLLDSDAMTNGMTVNEVLTSGENNTSYDAGLYTPASLGNYVWEDTNANGIQEAGENPIAGVTVVLTGTTGDGKSYR
jgi:hypothetical protein